MRKSTRRGALLLAIGSIPFFHCFTEQLDALAPGSFHPAHCGLGAFRTPPLA
jgi:hypothetical protein